MSDLSMPEVQIFGKIWRNLENLEKSGEIWRNLEICGDPDWRIWQIWQIWDVWICRKCGFWHILECQIFGKKYAKKCVFSPFFRHCSRSPEKQSKCWKKRGVSPRWPTKKRPQTRGSLSEIQNFRSPIWPVIGKVVCHKKWSIEDKGWSNWLSGVADLGIWDFRKNTFFWTCHKKCVFLGIPESAICGDLCVSCVSYVRSVCQLCELCEICVSAVCHMWDLCVICVSYVCHMWDLCVICEIYVCHMWDLCVLYVCRMFDL